MNLRSRRVSDPTLFFSKSGTGWMKLTIGAAQSVITKIHDQGLLISMIEAGIWHSPGFEARLDGILSEDTLLRDGVSIPDIEQYFHDLDPSYDTFIITMQKPKETKEKVGPATI